MTTMPIRKPYTTATVAKIESKAPQKSGVYELKSFGELKYIGSSQNLQKRLLTHVRERNPNKFRFKTTGFFGSHKKMEREHYNRYIDKNGSSPDWNDKRP